MKKEQSIWEIIIGVATIIGAIAFLVKIFSKNEEERVEQESKQSKKDLYGLVKPSYPEYRYYDWSKILETALMSNSTEDEDAVYSVFEKMKNISDVSKLVDAFGTKRKMFTTQYISLPQAIAEYFNPNEKKKLNNILSKKRIDYTFE